MESKSHPKSPEAREESMKPHQLARLIKQFYAEMEEYHIEENISLLDFAEWLALQDTSTNPECKVVDL